MCPDNEGKPRLGQNTTLAQQAILHAKFGAKGVDKDGVPDPVFPLHDAIERYLHGDRRARLFELFDEGVRGDDARARLCVRLCERLLGAMRA